MQWEKKMDAREKWRMMGTYVCGVVWLFFCLPSNWHAIDEQYYEQQRISQAIYSHVRRCPNCLHSLNISHFVVVIHIASIVTFNVAPFFLFFTKSERMLFCLWLASVSCYPQQRKTAVRCIHFCRIIIKRSNELFLVLVNHYGITIIFRISELKSSLAFRIFRKFLIDLWNGTGSHNQYNSHLHICERFNKTMLKCDSISLGSTDWFIVAEFVVPNHWYITLHL